MPAVSAAKVPCIAQLASELRFASKPTLLRHLQRIDELAPQIDPEGIYPQDWIIFRITGYRPEINTPALVPGEALRGDLSAIAEHISEHARLTQADITEPYETIDSLAARWSVSRKTIERYRRLGLIARRLDLGTGRRSIIFMRSAVEWFETLNTKRLGKAARFDRLSDAQLRRIERWAIVYSRRLNYSRSQAAARIALRTGHSHEGIRKALLRIDANAPSPIFTDPGPTTTRDQRFAYRASLRAIEPADIARHINRSPGATTRAINAARLALLESYDLPAAADPSTPADPTSALDSLPATTNLIAPTQTDLCALIESTRTREPPVPYEEQMRARAYHTLLQRAGGLFDSLTPATPSAPILDQIETDLRWAHLLKAQLVCAQLHLIGSTIEHQIQGPIDTLDPSRAAFLLLASIRIASNAIDRFDPTHTSRLAAPIGLAVTRFASQQPDIAAPQSPGKATRRISPGYTIPDWTIQITPWHRWLMPNHRIKTILNQLDQRDQVILTRRFGFDRCPPITRAALAELLGTSPIHAARFERQATRNARALLQTR